MKYIDEINISCGPSGELRYPSYSFHDACYDESGKLVKDGGRTGWPYRGALQCYGDLAVKDFQAKMAVKYGTAEKLKAAWGSYAANIPVKSTVWANFISLPNKGTDHGYLDKKIFKADQFFLSGDYYKTQYGRELIQWYNQTLLDHGQRMLVTAKLAFGGAKFKNIHLGFKIPGIHWQMGTLNPSDQPVAPRAAEIAAGLIRPSANFAATFDLNAEMDTNGHGYANILSLGKDGERSINVHFTCLEMGNKKSGGAEDTPNQYSLASALVGWLATEAYKQGVTIKGENALNGGLQWAGDWVDDWDRMNWDMERYPFAGLTILRISDVTTAVNSKLGKTVGKNCYEQMIKTYRSYSAINEPTTIYFKATRKTGAYMLKPLGTAGLAASYKMTYDGKYQGGYWWKVTINAPACFKFNVANSTGVIEA